VSDLPYDVFISYRRSDGSKTAQWLRRELQSFRAPRALREKFSRKLKVYLDVAFEKGTVDFYEHTIRPALLASRHLVVVATPDAAQRDNAANDWIKREIDEFSAGAHGSNLLLVRGAGAFDGPLPGDLSQRYKNIEIVDLRDVSRLWFLNPLRASRIANEKLKLIAPILGIEAADMPVLRREEERRAQSRIALTLGVLLGIFTAVATLTVFTLNARNRATVALESSLSSTGSLILSLGRMAGARNPTKQELSGLISDACDVFDNLRVEANADPRARPLVVCYGQRARDHEDLKELPQARALLEAAVIQSSAIHRRSHEVDDARSVVSALGALREFLAQHGTAEERRSFSLREAGILDGLIADQPDEIPFVEARAMVAADIAGETGADQATPETLASLDEVADLAGRSADKDYRLRATLHIWQARLLALAGQFGKRGADDASADRFRRAETALQQAVDDPEIKPEVKLEAAETWAGLAGVYAGLDRTDDFERARQRAATVLAAIDNARLSQPDKARAQNLGQRLAEAGGASGKTP
jgi:hypothetical protein